MYSLIWPKVKTLHPKCSDAKGADPYIQNSTPVLYTVGLYATFENMIFTVWTVRAVLKISLILLN